MLDYGFYNIDCMAGMSEFPDKYFDLAICDPPYGGVTDGGYMHNKVSGGVARNPNDYHLSVFQTGVPDGAYFQELRRVSKNQIIWGGITLLHIYPVHNAGSYGIKKSPRAYVMRIASSLIRRSMSLREYSGSSGTVCNKAT